MPVYEEIKKLAERGNVRKLYEGNEIMRVWYESVGSENYRL